MQATAKLSAFGSVSNAQAAVAIFIASLFLAIAIIIGGALN